MSNHLKWFLMFVALVVAAVVVTGATNRGNNQQAYTAIVTLDDAGDAVQAQAGVDNNQRGLDTGQASQALLFFMGGQQLGLYVEMPQEARPGVQEANVATATAWRTGDLTGPINAAGNVAHAPTNARTILNCPLTQAVV